MSACNRKFISEQFEWSLTVIFNPRTPNPEIPTVTVVLHVCHIKVGLPFPENFLSSFFSVTFKPKILQSFISSQLTISFRHDSQKTSLPTTPEAGEILRHAPVKDICFLIS